MANPRGGGGRPPPAPPTSPPLSGRRAAQHGRHPARGGLGVALTACLALATLWTRGINASELAELAAAADGAAGATVGGGVVESLQE